MKLKKGVKLNGVKPETIVGMMVVDSVYQEHNSVLTVTSVCDGKHGRGSFHYLGMAFDCRIRDLREGVLDEILKELRRSLTAEFDIVEHSTHIHIEYNPK